MMQDDVRGMLGAHTWLVVTTVNARSLQRWLAQLWPRERFTVVVVGDKKGEEAITDVVANWGHPTDGAEIEHLTVAVQQLFLGEHAALAKFAEHQPWMSETRRNVGYLYVMAHADPDDVVIIVDDDNLPSHKGGWISQHRANLSEAEREVLRSTDTGFFNPNALLHAPRHWMRGYPPAHRVHTLYGLRETWELAPDVSMGLWTEAPDVDAATWLSVPDLHSRGVTHDMVLGSNVWCPINTQNTALRVRLLPSFPCVVSTPRYGDIYGGYILQADQQVTVHLGNPTTRHERHAHDYLHDLVIEQSGMIHLDRITDELRACAGAAWDDIVEVFHDSAVQDFLFAYREAADACLSR